jgi:hypothetical protein
MLGHADRIGLRDDDASKSWNSSHLTRPGWRLPQADLRSTGGMVCFIASQRTSRHLQIINAGECVEFLRIAGVSCFFGRIGRDIDSTGNHMGAFCAMPGGARLDG